MIWSAMQARKKLNITRRMRRPNGLDICNLYPRFQCSGAFAASSHIVELEYGVAILEDGVAQWSNQWQGISNPPITLQHYVLYQYPRVLPQWNLRWYKLGMGIRVNCQSESLKHTFAQLM